VFSTTASAGCPLACRARVYALNEPAVSVYLCRHRVNQVVNVAFTFILDLSLLGQELIPYRYSSCVCSCSYWGGRPSSKKKPLRLRRFKCDRNEICRVVPRENMLQLTESDFRFDVIIVSRWRSCIKVLPPGECTRSVFPAPMQKRPSVPDL